MTPPNSCFSPAAVLLAESGNIWFWRTAIFSQKRPMFGASSNSEEISSVLTTLGKEKNVLSHGHKTMHGVR